MRQEATRPVLYFRTPSARFLLSPLAAYFLSLSSYQPRPASHLPPPAFYLLSPISNFPTPAGQFPYTGRPGLPAYNSLLRFHAQRFL